jgi:hypothetical protein
MHADPDLPTLVARHRGYSSARLSSLGSMFVFLGPQSVNFVAGLVIAHCVFLLAAIFRGIWSFS